MAQNMISDEKIMQEVIDAIVHTTGVEKDTITPDSSLVDDLGVLSLDFLDVNFRLQQVFGVTMARNFVLEHVEELFGEGTANDENNENTRLEKLSDFVAKYDPSHDAAELLYSQVDDDLLKLAAVDPDQAEIGAVR